MYTAFLQSCPSISFSFRKGQRTPGQEGEGEGGTAVRSENTGRRQNEQISVNFKNNNSNLTAKFVFLWGVQIYMLYSPGDMIMNPGARRTRGIWEQWILILGAG